ncbi:MAG: hypothetical protein WEB58_20940 [Planctomycetaceae bacterium]
MQFGHKLRQIGFITGVFLLMFAGHHLSKTFAPSESPLPMPAFAIDDDAAYPLAIPRIANQPDEFQSAATSYPLAEDSSVDSEIPSMPSPVTTALAADDGVSDAEAVPARFDDTGARPLDLNASKEDSPDVPVSSRMLDQAIVAFNDSPRTEKKADPKSKTVSNRRTTPAETNEPKPGSTPEAERLAPQKIADADDASPLSSDRKSTGTFDALFDEEWPDATREEREIWGSQLNGIPPETVRELLRLRQHHTVVPPQRAGPRLPGAESHSPSTAPPVSKVPNFPAHGNTQAVRRAFAVLHMAQAITLQNLIHAKTPGYKARIVSYAEGIPADLFAIPRDRARSPNDIPPPQAVPYEDDSEIAGDELALDQRIDVQQGSLRETQRAWDVAIDGRGWFRTTKEGETFYTRNGRWSLTESRMLALRARGADYVIHPPILVPESISQIIITAKGEVIGKMEPVIRPQAEPGDAAPLGTIVIYGFLDESALVPVATSLYAASPASGPPIDLTTGDNIVGELKQGFLEDANVDAAGETQHWEQLQRFQQMLGDLFPEPAPVAFRRVSPHR